MPETDNPANDRSLRVLVVDDHASCRALATTFAKRQGHSVESVSNAQEALAAIAREPFDVVLMDIAMPDLDGIEATRIIRAAERETDTRMRIVAVTGGAAEIDREQCLAAGMDDYVPKPMSEAQLAQVLAPARRTGPILIVEDNEAIRHALVVFLDLNGYETVTADNGAAAISVLQSLAVPPSLILLDLMMPVMDGLQFRKRLIVEYPQYASIPVVVISAYGELIQNGRSLAAAASLAKPFNPDMLLTVVDEHCVRTRKPTRRARDQRQVAASA